MHDMFSDWYANVDLEPSPDVLTRRWACVESAVKQLTPYLALDLVRTFLAIPGTATNGEPNDVSRVFKAADKTFPMTGNARLLRVLSGAALVQAFAKKHKHALNAALATLTASCDGTTGEPAISCVLEKARQYAASVGAQARVDALAESESPDLLLPDDELNHTTPDLQDVSANQWPSINNNYHLLNPWLKQTDKAVRNLIESVAAIAEELKAIGPLARGSDQDRVAALREECEILWWLFGEATNDGTPFARLAPARAAIVCALELADRTRLTGPVPAARAFLEKTFGPSKGADKFSLAELLEHAGNEVCVRAANAGQAVATTWAVTPVLLAATKGAELATPKAWVENCGLGGAFSSDFRLTARDWSLQLYQECLLTRALRPRSNG